MRVASNRERNGVVLLALAAAAVAVAALVFLALLHEVVENDEMTQRDEQIMRLLVDHRTPALEHVASWVTQLGSFVVLAPVAILAALVLRRCGAPVRAAIAPLVALCTSALIVAVIKSLLDRERPPVAIHLAEVNSASFPSGHSADSTALYLSIAVVVAVLFVRRPVYRVLLVAGTAVLPFLIGLSRLVLGVHWPSDVAAGWALGSVVAGTVTTVLLWPRGSGA